MGLSGGVLEWEATALAPVIGIARLCIAGLLQALALLGLRRAIHTIHPLYTGVFRLPVGVVGNKGRETGSR